MQAPLPPDPFWPIRVKVKVDGACIPFEMWMWYHWQFFISHANEVA